MYMMIMYISLLLYSSTGFHCQWQALICMKGGFHYAEVVIF